MPDVKSSDTEREAQLRTLAERLEFRMDGAGGRYTLKLTAIDFSGNAVKAPGPPLEIVMPSREVAKRQ